MYTIHVTVVYPSGFTATFTVNAPTQDDKALVNLLLTQEAVRSGATVTTEVSEHSPTSESGSGRNAEDDGASCVLELG